MKYNQLSETSKEKAYNWFISSASNINFDETASDMIEDLVLSLAEIGIDVKIGRDGPCVYYSGFQSQGDGACFEAAMDVLKYIEKNKLKREVALLYKTLKDSKTDAEFYTEVNHSSSRYFHHKSVSYEYTIVPEIVESPSNTFYPENFMRNFGWSKEKCIRYDKEARYLSADFEDRCDSEMQDFYAALEKAYYSLTSEDSAKDFFDANEIEFDKDGNVEQ